VIIRYSSIVLVLILPQFYLRFKNVKYFPSYKVHRAALISISVTLSQTPAYTTRPRIFEANASRGVLVYVSAFAGTHCAYPRRDGQAEFDWYTEMVHPSGDGHTSDLRVSLYGTVGHLRCNLPKCLYIIQTSYYSYYSYYSTQACETTEWNCSSVKCRYTILAALQKG